VTGDVTTIQDLHQLSVFYLKYEHEGDKLFTASFDGTLKKWNAKTTNLEETRQIPVKECPAVATPPRGK
jgi:WD40 repeat protein